MLDQDEMGNFCTSSLRENSLVSGNQKKETLLADM